MWRIGIDAGGTFTDFVAARDGEVKVLKLPSTPGRPQEALLEGLRRLLGEDPDFYLQHGSTVATNALLERKGAKTLLLTNQGFEDLLEIGRQNRPELYNLSASRPQPLVPPQYRIGVRTRISWDGQQLVPLEPKSLDWVRNKVEQLAPESIAVCLLYSYVSAEDERRIAEALEAAGIPLSLSHQVLPEFREYERTSATVVNAYLLPVMSSYLRALEQDPRMGGGKLAVMQSNGGSISASTAAAHPVRTLFSGPAGGVVGAFEVARRAGFDRIITFDMGGTSTDVCLCDGAVPRTREAVLGHHPIPIQAIDIHSVGAGGGSIAWVDEGGLLRVGPHSAGADPGPVCYGRGEEVTVTDAHLHAGMLNPDWFLGGDFALQPERVRPALERLASRLAARDGREWGPDEVADGILRIVATQTEAALRVISLERGHDTRDFTLVSFGGAGGLHACRLADSLLIPRVLVPAQPGVLSAHGILRADIVKDAALTVLLGSGNEDWRGRLEDHFRSLEESVRSQLASEGSAGEAPELLRSADLRYLGQSFEVQVRPEGPSAPDWLDLFHREHQRLYGYGNPELPVEIVTVRVEGRIPLPSSAARPADLGPEEPPLDALLQEKQVQQEGRPVSMRFYLRHRLQPGNRLAGPCVLLEYSSTTLVPEGWEGLVNGWGDLVIERRE